MKALLARGAKPEAHERRGQTALMWAAAEGHTAVVRALLEAEPISTRSRVRIYAVLLAVREGHLETVRAFLAAGIDVNAMLQRPANAPGGGG